MRSLSHQFLDFCRSKPADETFRYGSCQGCAFAQFLIDTGLATRPNVGSTNWNDLGSANPYQRREIPAIVYNLLDSPNRHDTFGALASRLEKALAQ